MALTMASATARPASISVAAVVEDRSDQLGRDFDNAGRATVSRHGSDLIVRHRLARAAQACGNDADEVARRQPPLAETFGQRDLIVGTERGLKLRQRAERQHQRALTAAKLCGDLATMFVGHRFRLTSR